MPDYLSATEAFQLVQAGKLDQVLYRAISDYFIWGEVFAGCTAREIKAAPLWAYANSVDHSKKLMDKIRKLFNRKVLVHDWYRGNIVKDRQSAKGEWLTHDIIVGGTGNGYHPKGLATDFEVDGVRPREVHAKLDKVDFMQKAGLEDPVYEGIHADSRGYRARFGPN